MTILQLNWFIWISAHICLVERRFSYVLLIAAYHIACNIGKVI